MCQNRVTHYQASINASLKNIEDTNQSLPVYAKRHIL